jgi:hypothetical protein
MKQQYFTLIPTLKNSIWFILSLKRHTFFSIILVYFINIISNLLSSSINTLHDKLSHWAIKIYLLLYLKIPKSTCKSRSNTISILFLTNKTRRWLRVVMLFYYILLILYIVLKSDWTNCNIFQLFHPSLKLYLQ